MKKKIINGLMMVALIAATSASFVSCKDTNEDELFQLKNQLNQDVDNLQDQIDDLGNTYATKLQVKEVNDSLTALKGRVNGINTDLGTAQQDIKDLQADIKNLQADINDFRATLEDALRIQQLAQQYGIKVVTNYETTWYSTNHYAKQLIDEGKIGEMRRINVQDGHQGPFEINCEPRFTDWLCDPILNGGGAVMDFGCYGADIVTWLRKGERPQSVYAVLQQNKPDKYPKVDDDATITLQYPGMTAQIMASWCWPCAMECGIIQGL